MTEAKRRELDRRIEAAVEVITRRLRAAENLLEAHEVLRSEGPREAVARR